MMIKSSISKSPGIIDFLIQTNDCTKVVFPEVGKVSLWGVEGIT